jgi:hypothetical protein
MLVNVSGQTDSLRVGVPAVGEQIMIIFKILHAIACCSVYATCHTISVQISRHTFLHRGNSGYRCGKKRHDFMKSRAERDLLKTDREGSFANAY